MLRLARSEGDAPFDGRPTLRPTSGAQLRNVSGETSPAGERSTAPLVSRWLRLHALEFRSARNFRN